MTCCNQSDTGFRSKLLTQRIPIRQFLLILDLQVQHPSHCQVSALTLTYRKYTIALLTKNQFSYAEISSEGFTLNWGEFAFIFQCNYHICANSFPNPCEDGVITISTVPNNGVKMAIGINVDLSQPIVAVTASSAQLICGPNDIEVDVFCTNTICLIPVIQILQMPLQVILRRLSKTVSFLRSILPPLSTSLNPL